MNVTSIGFQTDFMLASFDGAVEDHPHYVVVRTPTSPLYWWGNFILFDHAPRDNDAEHWEAIFNEEIGRRPGISHVNLAWDTDVSGIGEVEPFLARGYSLTREVFLFSAGSDAAEAASARAVSGVELRPIDGDREWDMALQNQHRCLGNNDTPEFRRFQADQMARYRKMVAAHFGFWLGAFMGGRLVADMGIFGNRGIARCQTIGTDPDFRGRGIAGAMIAGACRLAGQRLAANTVVIMTWEQHPARRLYERLGFVAAEHGSSLARHTRAAS
jgi:GNAT superfamily N-acetyltransferase